MLLSFVMVAIPQTTLYNSHRMPLLSAFCLIPLEYSFLFPMPKPSFVLCLFCQPPLVGSAPQEFGKLPFLHSTGLSLLLLKTSLAHPLFYFIMSLSTSYILIINLFFELYNPKKKQIPSNFPFYCVYLLLPRFFGIFPYFLDIMKLIT